MDYFLQKLLIAFIITILNLTHKSYLLLPYCIISINDNIVSELLTEVRVLMLSNLNFILKELELSFNRLSENNIQLRKEKGDLGAQLEARTAEKAALEKEMEKLKSDANSTVFELKAKLVSRWMIHVEKTSKDKDSVVHSMFFNTF